MDFLELKRSMPLVFVFTSGIISWIIYKYIQYRSQKLPPGPTGLPLLGYIPFLGKEPFKEFLHLNKKYGPLFSLSLGSYKTVVASDYDTAKELLCHPATLSRHEDFFSFLPYNGGFISMSGDPWKEQRRFSVQTMRNLGIGKGPWEQIIQEDVMEFTEYLHEYEGKPVDVGGLLLRSATSNNTALLVGRRFAKKETNPDVKIIEAAHRAIMEHGKLSNPAILIPWLFKYMVKFNIAGYAEKASAMENLCTLFRREVTRHQDNMGRTEDLDFIGHYFEAMKKGTAEGVNYYSVENLIGNMVLLFFAGSDTTTASIHWLLVLMAAHPEVQEKVQQEIDGIIGRAGQVGWDDRKKLPYTMAAILEMERWASILPFYPVRRVTEAFKFREYTIPKDTMIVSNNWAIQRDPKYWKNEDEYVPERILQAVEKSGKDPSKVDGYAAFSFGKRNCPGETVAIMTIFLYFVGIMQKFTIKVPHGKQVNLSQTYDTIMHPRKQELCYFER